MRQGEPITEHSAEVLRQLGYSGERIRLLQLGLPVTYRAGGALVVEYPDGRRVEVVRRDVHDERGQFQRYAYTIVRELPAQSR